LTFLDFKRDALFVGALLGTTFEWRRIAWDFHSYGELIHSRLYSTRALRFFGD